jgi:hypothetical protein
MAKYRFKLLGGQHIESDKSKPILGPDDKPTGRYEKRVYSAGAVIESDTDLAAKHGANKYELLHDHGGESGRVAQLERELADARAKLAARGVTPGDAAVDNPSVAPGGQVSSGFQAATADGSRAMLAEEAASHGGNVEAFGAGQAKGGRKARGAKAVTQEEADADADADDDLDGMTVKELREKAADDEISLHGATTKDEIVKAMRAARRK